MAGNNVSFGVGAKGVGKASSDIDRLRDKWEKLQKQGAKGVGIGIAAGATSFALGAMQQAISEVTDVLGDSVTAALDDEASIQKLGTALKDNIPNWDGNTDAIEKTLAAQEDKGYSDDEQRASLATLASATHDVTKALEIQQGAMDISRARGIDLASASDAVAKAYAGNTKGLKSVLPGLKLGATSAETLANAFRMVNGAAEDYAATNRGKLLVDQVKVGEAVEKFGYTIMPAAVEVLGEAADRAVEFADQIAGITGAVTELATHLPVIGDAAAKNEGGLLDMGAALLDAVNPSNLSPKFRAVSDFMDGLGVDTQTSRDLWNSWGFDVGNSAATVDQDIEDMRESARGNLGRLDDALADSGEAAVDFRDKYFDATGDIIRRSARVTDALIKDAAKLRGEVFDETEIRADLHDQRLALFALQDKARDAKTVEDKRQASDDIMQALDDEGGALEDLAEQGKLTAQDVDQFTKDAKANYKDLSVDGRAKLDALIARYKTLASQPNITKTFTLNEVVTHDKGSANDTHGKGHGQLEFDTGGVVPGPPGAPQLATVHGGETVFTPDQLRALKGDGAGGDTYVYNINVNGRWDVDERSVAAALARMKAISKKRPKVAA